MRAPSLILILFLCATCGSPQRESMGDIDADFESLKEMPMNAQPAPVTKVGNTQAVTKKLIKTGSIEFQSEDIEEDYHSIQALLPHFEAYLENESQSRSSSRITNNLTVRVPSENYDSLYHLLSDLAYRLENRYSNIEDATDRYYDLKTRIENKQVLEKRYLEILEQASMVKDILEVEKNLNEVRTEI